MNIFSRLFLIGMVVLIASCNGDSEEAATDKKPSKKITSRNYFINKQNAFSDFFFDSLELVKYISDRQLPDSVTRRMTSFYNSRNYQFAWFSSEGVSEQARGFWNMYKYYLSYDPGKVQKDAAFTKNMDRLVESQDSVWAGKLQKLTATELQLTEYFLRFYLANVSKGYLKRKEIEKFIPYIKTDPVKTADSLVNKKHKDDRYYGDHNQTYGALLGYLSKYVNLYKNGGWPVVVDKASLVKKDKQGPAVVHLKRRLYLSEDLATNDSSDQWTEALTAAIKKFQYRHGYKPTGILSDAQLKDMNVPLKHRIEQLLLNMGRSQWVIDEPRGKFILVNIPEFLMHVTEDGKKIFNMRVVVGKEGHNTTVFTGRLSQVVFSPYWNVPESIIENEIVPAMQDDDDYLSKNNMEITGKLTNELPAIRQLPGEKNSLGLVKFLFPNSYDIYFHDTPAKSLFAKDKRAYSHGCIRLSEPVKLAAWLLQDDPKWKTATISEAMHAKEEKTVSLKSPVPVLITYYTAWTDENGLLRFAGDVYGHDRAQLTKMFEPK